MSNRLYQQKFKQDVYDAWHAGYQNVCGVMPTGSGKSYTVGEIVQECDCYTVVVAHRQELVGQLSLAIAQNGVMHQIICPDKVRKFIVSLHLSELGANMVHSNARVFVVGVDTLVRRAKQHDRMLKQAQLWVTDECHHIVRGNKWGNVCEMMPNAYGLGVTATPIRADGQGLGRHADGVMDFMVEGPGMRELIEAKYLTDYRIFAPPSDVDYSQVNIGQSGDYVHKQLKQAVRESHLVGDVVQHYQRIAPGKLGITFATDVETAGDIARQFNLAGVPAEVVSAKTADRDRVEIIRRFRNRQLLQLVNVDLFGEGFDLPAIEVVSMARRTQSYSLYSQQFGRALRPLEGKKEAIIIDHAGNVMMHGLPDSDRVWSLDSRDKRPSSKNPDDDIPLRYCVECTQPYPRTNKTCPFCGHYPVPAGRDKPEYVDGDLHELSPQALQAMRVASDNAILDPNKVVERAQFAGAPQAALRSLWEKGMKRRNMQFALRESIAWFAQLQANRGHDSSTSYRMFYHLFGIDVMSAQALGRPEAETLANKVNEYIGSQW